jgi:hypothetical protein
LGVGACGGASHSSSTTRTAAANPEQTRLLSQLRSGLEDPTSPVANVRDLDECIVQQAKHLPLASVRKLAAGSVGTADTNPLVARCIAQGKGLSWVRGTIADVVAGKLPPPIPAAFHKCVVAGVGKLTPAQLAASLNKSAAGDQSYSRRLGQRIALDCVQKPPVFKVWRKLWVADIRRSLNGRHLPAAFVQCVLDKAGKIGATELVKLVQAGSAAETAYGEKLGRACRASLSG